MHTRDIPPPRYNLFERFFPNESAWLQATFLDLNKDCSPDICQDILKQNKALTKKFDVILDICQTSVMFHERTGQLKQRFFKNIFEWLAPGGEFWMCHDISNSAFLWFHQLRVPPVWVPFYVRYAWVKGFIKFLLDQDRIDLLNEVSPGMIGTLRVHKLMANKSGPDRKKESKRMFKEAIAYNAEYAMVHKWLTSLRYQNISAHESSKMCHLYIKQMMLWLQKLFVISIQVIDQRAFGPYQSTLFVLKKQK